MGSSNATIKAMSASHALSAPSTPSPSTWRAPLLTLLVIAPALLTFALTMTPGPAVLWPRWAAMMVLAWWLPGALLVAHWRLAELDLPTAFVLALGLGFGWMMTGALLVHWLPGAIGFWTLALTNAVAALALGLALHWRPPLPLITTPRRTWMWLLGLLLLTLALRIPGLAYHEFHYDEVLVLTRAREAIRGEDDALARHTKGPGEIAAAIVVFRTLGTANEGTARLLFGLASAGSVLALALLGRRMFASDHVGFWSGLLLALNGFALGLSRIVQYQAAVLLLMVLAVLAAWRFTERGALRWLVLAALLSAWGLTLHYEFGLVAPALLFLLWKGWPAVGDKRRALGQLTLTTLAGAIWLAAVYVPLYLNPFFSQTQSYLGTRLGRLGSTFNLSFFVEMGTFYNSVYFFLGLILLMLAGIFIGWRRERRATIALSLWFTPFLVLYLFIVQFPGTHFYLLMPSWSVLAAVTIGIGLHAGLQRVWGESQGTVDPAGDRPPARAATQVVLYGVLALWLAVSSYYLYLMFFRQEPEYLINYQAERAPFYWAPYGENVPEKPRFGFPIREGWKTLGVLSEWKVLNGAYASNERSRHLRWYLGDFDRVPFEEAPDFIFVARHLQEPDPAYSSDRLNGYTKAGDVIVRDESRIEIWSREALPAPDLLFDAGAFTGVFDGLGPTFAEWPEPPESVREVALDEQVSLVSGGYSPATVRAGDVLHARLVWQTQAPLDVDYKRFFHVAGADDQPAVQLDGLPRMNTSRTSAWAPGEAVEDQILLLIPPQTPPGVYRLLTGLYDPNTGDRVGDKAIDLGEVRIR